MILSTSINVARGRSRGDSHKELSVDCTRCWGARGDKNRGPGRIEAEAQRERVEERRGEE